MIKIIGRNIWTSKSFELNNQNSVNVRKVFEATNNNECGYKTLGTSGIAPIPGNQTAMKILKNQRPLLEGFL